MNEEDIKCRKCKYEAKDRKELSRHIADVHDVDVRQNKSKNPKYFHENRINVQGTEFCIYWDRGYCKFGDRCFNTHGNTPYCYFQDRCDRKDSCKFYHEDFLDNGRKTSYHR